MLLYGTLEHWNSGIELGIKINIALSLKFNLKILKKYSIL
jgi:hypothetical protein